MKEIFINEKRICIYCKDNIDNVPLIILNSFEEDEKLYDKISKDSIIVSISNIDWDNELTPFKYNNFKGNADKYLDELINVIIPEILKNININISYYVIGGYSLAGLFALYSVYKTDLFKKVLSISGSLWYPGIVDFIKSNKISNNVDEIYFSLGDKEKNTKNSVMSKVEDNTREIYEYLSENVNSIFEMNPGTHFNDPNKRILKGIEYILK